jgi:alanine dehydrogenase
MLYFTEEDVRRLLPMDAAVRQVRACFEQLASSEGKNQSRRRLILPTGAVLHSLAGAFNGYFGTKVYSTSRQGAWFLLLLYRAEDGRPVAIFEANYLGQIRTGAASGVATDLLAPSDASTVGIIGSGFQARAQLEAVCRVRPIQIARVWSRSPEKRSAFAAECSAAFGIPVQAAASAEEAVCGASIVITATNAKEPVLRPEWIASQAHINAIGSNSATRRELPAELIYRADLIAVDSREQAQLESGDLLLALDAKGWQDPKIVELVELFKGTGTAAPRRGITIFKSNGLGIEDVAVAAYVAQNTGGQAKELPLFHS